MVGPTSGQPEPLVVTLKGPTPGRSWNIHDYEWYYRLAKRMFCGCTISSTDHPCACMEGSELTFVWLVIPDRLGGSFG